MWRRFLDIAALLLEVLRLALGNRRGKHRGVGFVWKRPKNDNDDED